ncbi:MAG: rhodanese-like domain-containing protein [Deltaproteobacteria bacterium]|nr:rhodanese-like domain-containing protein [Deltaproteobacteria bacterium]
MAVSVASKTLQRMLILWLFSAGAALAFNWLAPQGLGWLPPEVAQPRWQPVSLAEGHALYEQGALLVDARDPGQYKAARVRGAVNLYPKEFHLIYPLLQTTLVKSPVVVVYGRSTSRWPAATVAQRLVEAGLAQVRVMEGGLDDWRAAGFPVAERKRRES